MAKRTSQFDILEVAARDDYIPILDVSAGVIKRITVQNLTGLPDFGWTATGESHSYSSWTSGTRTGVITVPTDATTKYSPGMRYRFEQATGGTKYAIITAVSATSLTLFLPSGTTLNNEAITSPVYSAEKAPVGFNQNPVVWTLSVEGNFLTTAESLVWAQLNSGQLALPVGAWRFQAIGNLGTRRTASVQASVNLALSTATNAVSNSKLVALADLADTGTSGTKIVQSLANLEDYLNLAAAATYYLIYKNGGGGTHTHTAFAGNSVSAAADGTAVIKAICAYL